VLDLLRAKKENPQHGSATMSSVFFFGEFSPLGDQENWKKLENSCFLCKFNKQCHFTYLTKLEKKTLTMSKTQRNL